MNLCSYLEKAIEGEMGKILCLLSLNGGQIHEPKGLQGREGSIRVSLDFGQHPKERDRKK